VPTLTPLSGSRNPFLTTWAYRTQGHRKFFSELQHPGRHNAAALGQAPHPGTDVDAGNQPTPTTATSPCGGNSSANQNLSDRLMFSPEAWEDYMHPSSCFSRLLVAALRR
jgi:hypothetical protein